MTEKDQNDMSDGSKPKRKPRTDAKRMGAVRRRKGARKVDPAPIYDVVGWVTEREAAEVKNQIDPPESGNLDRTTISRWRGDGFVRAFDINGALTLVHLGDVKNFGGIPRGNPALVPYPPKAPSIPKTITITLQLRERPDEEPNKKRSQWDQWE